MGMERILDVLAGLSLLLILVVLRSVRRQHTRVEHSVAWLAAGLTLLVVSRFPVFWQRASEWMGFGQRSEGLLFMVLMVFLGVLYRFSVVISSLKDNNIALAQRVAILEFQLRSHHEESPSSPDR